MNTIKGKKIGRVIIGNDEKEKKLKKVNSKIGEVYMKMHFVLLILAARKTGKTNMILYLLLTEYLNLFDDIFIISPTIHSDKKWQALKIDDEKLFDNYSDDVLDSIIEFQEENPNNNTLIIMDDCIGQLKINSKMNKFVTMARHYGCSIIFSLQAVKGLCPTVRANVTSMIVMNNVKKQQLKQLEEEFFDDDFYQCYNKLKGHSKHNFVYIDYDGEGEYFINFDNEILKKDGTYTPANI